MSAEEGVAIAGAQVILSLEDSQVDVENQGPGNLRLYYQMRLEKIEPPHL
ncbi:MAG: hypothetical protein IPN87_20200 [Saprospiraceae bacterium]|nr:hypothetical protein [Candidatus Brachybacter algidus]